MKRVGVTRQVGLSATATRITDRRAKRTPWWSNRKASVSSAFKTDRSDLVDFLREDLDHLFDDQGIDVSKYDDEVTFRDPITKYDTIQGYVANIRFLKTIFRPKFTLHNIQQTGEDEITFRWTMDMVLTGINRELVFTGTSKLGINPETNRFSSHIDTWDAIRNQEYFSLEAFLHMLGQLVVDRTEALRGDVLLKRDTYEVLRRDGRVVVVPVGTRRGQDRDLRETLRRDGLDVHVENGTIVVDNFSFPVL